MPTIRQKKLARAVVDNLSQEKPLNKQELVASVGYTLASADKKATEILESKGVQEELKAFGFNSDKAKEVVAEILLGGENDTVRLKAADMIFKVNSDYAPEKHVTLNVNTTGNEQALVLAEAAYLAQLDEPTGPAESA